MQDAFIFAFLAGERFRGESQITTWLYRITVNAVLMKRRKEKKSKQLVTYGVEELPLPDMGKGPEKAALSSELKELIADGLEALPPDLRWRSSCGTCRAFRAQKPPTSWGSRYRRSRRGSIAGGSSFASTPPNTSSRSRGPCSLEAAAVCPTTPVIRANHVSLARAAFGKTRPSTASKSS